MKDKQLSWLVKGAKLHDSDAFTQLMENYMKDMYRVAISILHNDEDSADAIQDTILICWEKLQTLKEEKYFKTWMTRILINRCYDIRNEKKNLIVYEENVYEEIEDVATYDDYNVELKETLATLGEKYSVPMMLFYGQGYKIKEIAILLQIPESTVQTRLARGRKQLEKYYGIGRA